MADQPSPPVAAPAEKRVDVKFENLSARDAVSYLSKTLDSPLNVIFPGESGSSRLPSMRLQQVTLPEIFAAIGAAGEADRLNGQTGYRFAPVPGAPTIFTFEVVPPSMPPEPVGAGVPGAGLNDPRNTIFLDLAKILDEETTIEDLTTAIRTAWTAGGGVEPAADALKYHQETKLLIATGPPNRLDAVISIVNLLSTRNFPTASEQERKLEQVKRESDAALNEANRLMQQLDRIEKEREDQVQKLLARITELEILLAKDRAK